MTAHLVTSAATDSDEPARAAIRSELDTTMLVEAGAGSGKTTLMVDRLVAYAARGTPVDQLAAVTFTRKAANELRERLETRLEAESRNPARGEAERVLLQAALHDRERMFIGTVHAFCGRVLREHALDAGLPLDFSELDETETKELRVAAWHDFLERSATGDNPLLNAIAELGIDALSLTSAFEQYEQYRDVHFPAPHAPRPPHEPVRDALIALLERGYALRTAAGATTRDALQQTMDRLWRGYLTHDSWKHAPDFATDAATLLSTSKRKLTQKNWGDTKEQKAAAKSLSEDIDSFTGNALSGWYDAWWTHAYPHVIALLGAASDAALAHRRRAGQLGFDDLLTETARLLRENAHARRALGARWRHLLVDEFQDTDPVQAEVCFLLASDPNQGTDWRRVNLREGSLFVVGDPKQSIYRFRRADLATYRLVETRIAKCGRVLRLTQNFRSVPGVGALVNAHFRGVFTTPGDESAPAYQAPFAEFVASSMRPQSTSPAVAHYWVGPPARAYNPQIIAEDAEKLASWIAHRCTVVRDRVPQDFLILTNKKKELAQYAHQLALRNIPLSASGATSAVDEVITELLVVVRAIADPANAVAVIAALEGWCAGCSHAELWDARARRLEFRITHAPSESTSPVGRGLQQLYEWWTASQQLPPSSLIERIMDDSGLLLLAASDDLGDRNGGQLLQLVAMLRDSAVVAGDLTSAIAAIEHSLEQDDGDPALRVGRGDAVRLMNLHKAKGLEAPVVILASPVEPSEHTISMATWRDERDEPAAAMIIADDRGVTVARPQGWDAREQEETQRQLAERNRLLYVAVTRAQDELVVARRAPYMVSKAMRPDTSAWSPLATVLDAQSTELTLTADTPPGRRTLQVSTAEMASRVARATTQLHSASSARYELLSITEAAKRNASQAADDGAPLSFELAEAQQPADEIAAAVRAGTIAIDAQTFGSLVHAAIEGALRGRVTAQLTDYVGALVWHQLPNASAAERQQVAAHVMATVAQAQASAPWKALSTEAASTLAELNVATVTQNGAALVEGVIDVAAYTGSEWLVVDWKNSGGSDAGWQKVLPAYTAQAEAYLVALRQRTGKDGAVRIVRLTSS